MKISGNTILITGGGSGIGLELAKQFIAQRNTVVICGRDGKKLMAASLELPDVVSIECDVTDVKSVDNMIRTLKERDIAVNVIVNNAAKANAYFLGLSANAAEKALHEINTNYLAAVNLTEKFLPELIKHSEAGIVNMTSVVAIVPGLIVPTYSASKAALHSYTQSLRMSLSKFPDLRVFEVMPPVVDTEFSKDIPGHNRMAPARVALEIIEGIQSDKLEMHLGATASIFALHKENPSSALAALNRLA